jgi:hypothetical protein
LSAQSIQHHEKGVKHKQRVDDDKKKKREEKLYGAQNEAELKKQLQQIDMVSHL